MSKEKYDESMYYILGSEIATLMKIKDKIVELNTALKELKYSDNDITCHICLHHKYGSSYVPVIEIKKRLCFYKRNKRKSIMFKSIREPINQS